MIAEFIEAKHGRIAIYRDDTYIKSELTTHGTWEKHINTVFDMFVKPGDTVIDVGAFIGSHTLHLAHLVGDTGVVHAFEPVASTYHLLCINTRINNLRNVRTWSCGLSDVDGEMYYSDLQGVGNYGNITLSPDRQNESDKAVRVRMLDDLLWNPYTPRVSWIKIDSEGMELHVLQGATNLIARDKPVLVIEIHVGDEEPVFQWLYTHGYRQVYNAWPTTEYIVVPPGTELALPGLQKNPSSLPDHIARVRKEWDAASEQP